MVPLRARRFLAAVLAGTGLAALLAGAATQDFPLAESLAIAGRFWRAGPRGRLLNSPAFARDAAFAFDALQGAATWPVEEDAVLTVGPLVPHEIGERLRRKAAYLLAPRRVRVEPGTGAELSLARAPAGGPVR